MTSHDRQTVIYSREESRVQPGRTGYIRLRLYLELGIDLEEFRLKNLQSRIISFAIKVLTLLSATGVSLLMANAKTTTT